MPYNFAYLRCALTRKPQAIKRYADSVPVKANKKLGEQRSACVDHILSIEKAVKNNTKTGSKTGLATVDERAHALAELASAIDSYVHDTVSSINDDNMFAYMCFYFWSNPLIDDDIRIMVNDYRYDIFNLYFCAGVSFLNVSGLVTTCHSPSQSGEEALEKEAYHTLLQAAGYFDLSMTILQAMRAKPNTAMVIEGGESTIFDALHIVASALSSLALAQAQEIGVARAYRADSADNSELTAALAHQCALLYDDARSMLNKNSLKTNPIHESIRQLVVAKHQTYDMLLHTHTAAFNFRSSPKQGIAALQLAENKSLIVAALIKSYNKSPCTLPFGCISFLKDSMLVYQRKRDRIRTLNDLVHRFKSQEGTVKLPDPRRLAVAVHVGLPVTLPEVESPNPPECGTA